MKTQTVNGMELAVADEGSGPPLVLVHGFPLDHGMWSAQVAALSGQYRVIAPDLRGFGRSGVTVGKVTMEQFADDLAALLEALEVDRPVVFGGLSMGGYIGWAFWRKHRRRVRALILCDTRAAADTPEAAAGRLETADRVLREGAGALVETMIPKLVAPATFRAHPDVVESLRRVMRSTDPEGIAAAGRGMAQRPDATSMLPRIDCPCLVLVGRHDALTTPDQMRTMAEAIPGARFVEIPDAGHVAPVENPAAVGAAMTEFLGGLQG